MLSNKAQRLRPRRAAPGPPQRARLVQLPAPTHLSTLSLPVPQPGLPPCCPLGSIPLSSGLDVAPAPSSALFLLGALAHTCPVLGFTTPIPLSCNFHVTSPSLPTARLQDCLSSWSILLPSFDLPSFCCSLKHLPTPLVSPAPHPSPLARLCSSPATVPPLDVSRITFCTRKSRQLARQRQRTKNPRLFSLESSHCLPARKKTKVFLLTNSNL